MDDVCLSLYVCVDIYVYICVCVHAPLDGGVGEVGVEHCARVLAPVWVYLFIKINLRARVCVVG